MIVIIESFISHIIFVLYTLGGAKLINTFIPNFCGFFNTKINLEFETTIE